MSKFEILNQIVFGEESPMEEFKLAERTRDYLETFKEAIRDNIEPGMTPCMVKFLEMTKKFKLVSASESGSKKYTILH